jgi:hypothetical protein
MLPQDTLVYTMPDGSIGTATANFIQGKSIAYFMYALRVTKCRPFLEVAYWIGPHPGVWDQMIDQHYDLGQYRDRRTWARNNPGERDRWVVLHFHFDETRQVFVDLNGRTYAGFVSIDCSKLWHSRR